MPAELIQAQSNILRSENKKFTDSISNKELPQQLKGVITVPIYKNGDKTNIVIIEGHNCYQLHKKCYPVRLSQS